MSIALVLGGARSGKTRHALALARTLAGELPNDDKSGRGPVMVATAEPIDDEMAARIARHRAERDTDWRTVEAPLELVDALASVADVASVVLVDCLTVWLGNLMHRGRDVERAVDDLLSAPSTACCPLVFVSNEVGLGVVPDTPLGRRFRDEQGRLNQRIAAMADRVDFIAAGLPLRLK